jgi:hypothetical protein
MKNKNSTINALGAQQQRNTPLESRVFLCIDFTRDLETVATNPQWRIR